MSAHEWTVVKPKPGSAADRAGANPWPANDHAPWRAGGSPPWSCLHRMQRQVKRKGNLAEFFAASRYARPAPARAV